MSAEVCILLLPRRGDLILKVWITAEPPYGLFQWKVEKTAIDFSFMNIKQRSCVEKTTLKKPSTRRG